MLMVLVGLVYLDCVAVFALRGAVCGFKVGMFKNSIHYHTFYFSFLVVGSVVG